MTCWTLGEKWRVQYLLPPQRWVLRSKSPWLPLLLLLLLLLRPHRGDTAVSPPGLTLLPVRTTSWLSVPPATTHIAVRRESNSDELGSFFTESDKWKSVKLVEAAICYLYRQHRDIDLNKAWECSVLAGLAGFLCLFEVLKKPAQVTSRNTGTEGVDNDELVRNTLASSRKPFKVPI